MYIGLFFIFLVLWGMVIGWIAQLVLGRARKAKDRNWGQAIVAGTVGSLLAGTLVSWIAGEGLNIGPAGIFGSVIGAVAVVAIWNAMSARKKS